MSAADYDPEERADVTRTAIDTTVPHSARIWNYWLGGKDNFEVDRAAGDEFRQVFPAIADIARGSRQYLARAIHYLVSEAGIRQFLDVGTGLPTEDNTHELAQREAPESRIVYADNDPLVLTHARALLTSTPEGETAYLEADLRDPGKVVAGAAETLDFTQPIAIILNGVLGHLTDLDEARSIVRQFVDAVPSGSYLSVMDGTSAVAGHPAEEAQQGYNDSGALPYVLRTPGEIASFFEGLELVAPGVVSCTRWRPQGAPLAEEPAEIDAFGGVARKP
ncbi:MAG TPA: SAM-dependent methyltransferase [Streptosporangiaceae bacterium]|nr:SAM-dependent methyltransferase [Streptosporangiaceae bacterium]